MDVRKEFEEFKEFEEAFGVRRSCLCFVVCRKGVSTKSEAPSLNCPLRSGLKALIKRFVLGLISRPDRRPGGIASSSGSCRILPKPRTDQI
jgi:hypothetical protein